MANAARLVRRYGAMYWPIVERLQREIEAIKKRDALLASYWMRTLRPQIGQALDSLCTDRMTIFIVITP